MAWSCFSADVNKMSCHVTFWVVWAHHCTTKSVRRFDSTANRLRGRPKKRVFIRDNKTSCENHARKQRKTVNLRHRYIIYDDLEFTHANKRTSRKSCKEEEMKSVVWSTKVRRRLWSFIDLSHFHRHTHRKLFEHERVDSSVVKIDDSST